MKKRLLNTILGIIISISCVTPAFAQDIYFTNPSQSFTVADNTVRTIVTEPRGSVISTGILEISNPGNGEIGVFMQTFSHVDIDETTFGVYLERWIESEQTWSTVANYKFTYTKENSPDEDLMTKAISFNIIGQPTDCYYRLRGLHLVISGDTREMLSSRTDGILITKN